MRSVELAKVGAAAEALRLKRLVRRQVFRAIYAVIAVVFALAVFVLAHILIYEALAAYVRPWIAIAILFVFDLLVLAFLSSKVLNSVPDAIETEALLVRQQSLGQAKKALTTLSVLGEVTGFALGRGTRRALRGSKLAKFGLVADIASRVIRRR